MELQPAKTGQILIKKSTMITKNKGDINDEYEIEDKKVSIDNLAWKWDLWSSISRHPSHYRPRTSS
jgi:hypothetical protein